MKAIETSAIITGIRAKVDGSLGITIGTPELNVAEKVAVMSLQNINVKMTLEPSDSKPDDKLKVEKGLDGKRPSERLYNTIYVYWKQVKSDEEFESFYRRHMESIIDQYKSKLKQDEY